MESWDISENLKSLTHKKKKKKVSQGFLEWLMVPLKGFYLKPSSEENPWL